VHLDSTNNIPKSQSTFNMAPRRGGSSSSGSTSSCPGAFSSTLEQVAFACDVLFLAVFIGITIAMFMYRKRTSGLGKKLLSLPYIAAVLFYLLGQMCSVVASVLLQCRQTDFYSVYSWNIATTVFYNLSYILLLFVVVYTLNMMLRQQLGHVSKILKIALLVIVVFMGAITCVRIGLRSYYNWTFMQGLNSSWSSRAARVQFMLAVQRFSMAWDALYLLSVLAAGALALMTIVQLRSRRSPAGDLIGWVIALFLAMLFWIILIIVFAAFGLGYVDYSIELSTTLTYLLSFSQALSFIFIICIAKHASWNTSTVVADPVGHLDTYAGVKQHQQYGNNGHPNGQPYYYHEVPATTAYNGGVHAIKP